MLKPPSPMVSGTSVRLLATILSIVFAGCSDDSKNPAENLLDDASVDGDATVTATSDANRNAPVVAFPGAEGA
ncbi:MAG: hypothetical protein JKY56_26790, partial [Kofleriaceae bacterium]|nr:hypothetical protein [Kofleriaceae bacterium]